MRTIEVYTAPQAQQVDAGALLTVRVPFDGYRGFEVTNGTHATLFLYDDANILQAVVTPFTYKTGNMPGRSAYLRFVSQGAATGGVTESPFVTVGMTEKELAVSTIQLSLSSIIRVSQQVVGQQLAVGVTPVPLYGAGDTNLIGRTQLTLQNMNAAGGPVIGLGLTDAVTMAESFMQIAPGQIVSLPWGDEVTVYAVAAAAGSIIGVAEGN